MGKYEVDKIKISERSVIRRCNNFLKKEGLRLCKNRKTRAKDKKRKTPLEIQFGAFFILAEGKKGGVVEKRVDLEHFARKNGIIAPYEVVVKV